MNGNAPPGKNDKILFWASFATLIAAGIGFSVRGAILKDWGQQFGFTQSELGTITGGGLVGFGLAIIFFSFLADKFGYGKLMLVAFLLHASSAVVTFAATPVYNAYGKDGAYLCLYAGMWLFALGNGTCEAVINPLTATLFPKNKTHWLNILHAGWPLGLILGALIVLGFNLTGATIRWEFKLGVFLLPVLAYGFLMFGKTFPRSEAQAAGVPLSSMMKDVGLIGFTLGAALIGLALAQLIPSLLGSVLKIDEMILRGIGWGVAFCVWLAFGIATRFAPGHWLLAFLYVLHAMIGYVELGTDSWITNITEQILENQDKALLAFIWTNVLMFTLRFFAGPIVERINPIGLLFCSATLGVVGLYLLGNEAVDSTWPWIAAVTVYGVGKTFYWPTMLGVISERFPRGGALALGLAGGVGMIGAGILGGPGIGYKQDYFAVRYLEESPEGRHTYDRYMARKELQPDQLDATKLALQDLQSADKAHNPAKEKLDEIFGKGTGDKAEQLLTGLKSDDKAKRDAARKEVDELTKDLPDKKGFPLVTSIVPNQVPPIAGLDNAKLKIHDDYSAYKAKIAAAKKDGKEPPKGPATTLEAELELIEKLKAEGKPPEEKLEKTLKAQQAWWLKDGMLHFNEDTALLKGARNTGAKTALLYTAVVPLMLAIGFMLLIAYFYATGGYKQVHLEGEQPMGEY